jgi:hypothetical protein
MDWIRLAQDWDWYTVINILVPQKARTSCITEDCVFRYDVETYDASIPFFIEAACEIICL